MNRRDFLQSAALEAAAVWTLSAQDKGRILIQVSERESFARQLARKELLRGLVALKIPDEVRFAGQDEKPLAGDRLCVLRTDPAISSNPEAYRIAANGRTLLFTGAGEQALLYSVFDFLERQGAYFGIDGESYPLDAVRELAVPPAEAPWTASPRFAVRGLLPWPDFLNCITIYNSEDFRAYFEAMLRMRFNTFGMHVYTSPGDTESYLSFEFAGVNHTGYLDNTASGRWGYLPQRTSRYTMGGAQFFDSEVFGADATRLGRDPWDIAERTQKTLRGALEYAARLGIGTGVGFEPYQVPDEILRALPPEAKPRQTTAKGPRFDIESVVAKRLLETRLAQLLDAYPSVEYVWLWEDENMNWQSRTTGVPLSVTPFLQAHDFLRRHAPSKRLVLSGWGGMARNFEYFHQKMPGDVIFSCLGDSLGWDPTHEAFGKLEDRERWPIPWIEDDPAMWLPQFHVHRFERDLNLAEQYGCRGVLGIHWRHRIVDATAGYQARFSWDKTITPAEHYRQYARTQAAGPRVAGLADILTGVDRDQTILTTGTGAVKDGHVVTAEYSGDYAEGFQFWNKSTPSPELIAAQTSVAAALRELADGAQSAGERERIRYLSGYVGFLVPYTGAWVLAQKIQNVLNEALDLKTASKDEEAREKVRSEAVGLWLQLAPRVREAMLIFQGVVATRNDLGQLASMHNKFVRLALFRLRLSLEEFLGELPPETAEAFASATLPDDAAAARLFVPTRPSLLGKGERVRITIVAAGAGPATEATLHTRLRGAREWSAAPATLLGRRTWEATLGPVDSPAPVAEYYASAKIGNLRAVAPPDGPERPYLLTLAGTGANQA